MNEVCPSCGEFVRSLYELTGWCASCSTRHGRTCTRCDTPKPFHEFSRDRTRPDGRRPVCKPCDTAARTAREARRRAEFPSASAGTITA